MKTSNRTTKPASKPPRPTRHKPGGVRCSIMIVQRGSHSSFETEQDFVVVPRIGELVAVVVNDVWLGTFEVIGLTHPARLGPPFLIVTPIS
jgi:hypothetical protein